MAGEKSDYRRRLGLIELVSLGIGGTIGSGIFVVPGIAAGTLGSWSLLAWVIVAGSATCVMLSLAWIAPFFGTRGTFLNIFSELFGEKSGIVLVSLYLASAIFGISTIAAGIGMYLSFFGISEILIPELIVIALFCGINLMGVSLTGKTENLLTALKIAPLLVISLVLLTHIRPENFLPTVPVTTLGLLSTILIVYWPFTGFEISAIPVDEIREPGMIARSLVLVMLVVSSIYLLLNVSLIGSTGSAALAASPAPVATAVGWISSDAAILVGIIGIIAMLSAMNAYILGASRILHHVSRTYTLPRLKDLNKRGVPAAALVTISGVSAALLLVSNRFDTLAVLSVVTTLVPYIAFSIAAAKLIPGMMHRIVALAGAMSSAIILALAILL
ncbi:MAG: APC family permease [Methanolinea sp.]|nr:APC family permease [Methanolinea sp.]